MDADRITTTLIQNQVQPRSNSLMLPDTSFKAYRTGVWPAVLVLAFTPTANIQMSSAYGSPTETCVQVRRRSSEEEYEVFSSWYNPRWEDARVPQLRIAGHIQATYKFQGQLKWLPYQHF